MSDGPDFSKAELIPVIAQDLVTGDVLMLAYMNQAAYQETLQTGRVCYWSRSRQKLWRKGEESGNVQELKEIYYDCDADTLLVKVNQIGGAACHEGYKAASSAVSTRRAESSRSSATESSTRRWSTRNNNLQRRAAKSHQARERFQPSLWFLSAFVPLR